MATVCILFSAFASMWYIDFKRTRVWLYGERFSAMFPRSVWTNRLKTELWIHVIQSHCGMLAVWAHCSRLHLHHFPIPLVRHNLPSVHFPILPHDDGMKNSGVSLLYQGSQIAGLCTSEGVGHIKWDIDPVRAGVCFCGCPSFLPTCQFIETLSSSVNCRSFFFIPSSSAQVARIRFCLLCKHIIFVK